MEYTPPGRMRTVEDFVERWHAIGDDLGADIELQGAAGPLGRSVELCGRRVGNRFAIHPMEGWDAAADGAPSEHTLRRWHNFGRSGAALIWGGEAFAVQEDGRANPGQLFLNPARDVTTDLEALRAQVIAGRDEMELAGEPYVLGLQLTHSGRFARPTAEGPAPRIVHHHPVLAARYGIDPELPLLTDIELDAIGENFVAAAKVAQRTGYDFVDVKCCHGYLLHELLGAHTRPGAYGGSFENRTRLFRRIVEAIGATCPGLEVACRVSICDLHPFAPDPKTRIGTVAGWDAHLPYRYGFGVDPSDPRRPDFEEPRRFLALLQELGIRMVNLSVGSPYYNPHVQRPATYPPSDGYLPPEDPLHGVAFHVRAVRACRGAAPDLITVGSGYSYLQEWLPQVAQYEVRKGHVDIVGLGRMVLSYPDFPADVLAGRPLRRKAICRTFSDCTTAPRHGLISGCYPLDDHYAALPEATRVADIKKKLRPS
ncbi:MAG: NADH:flavin oxidoreductase [Planctomycetes bacterium]|nr:NADH:flavin oxidoreductase [Planctomycetota bacterium]